MPGSHKSKGALKDSYQLVITKMCFKCLDCFKLETRLCLIRVLRNVQLPAGKQRGTDRAWSCVAGLLDADRGLKQHRCGAAAAAAAAAASAGVISLKLYPSCSSCPHPVCLPLHCESVEKERGSSLC